MTYKHFTEDERHELQGFLKRQLTCQEIAYRMDKNPTSISREVKRNRIFEGRRYGHSSNATLCVRFKECQVSELCERCSGRSCRTCKKADCTKLCDTFEKETCSKLTRFPYVCNGCERSRSCKLERYSYSANVANAKAVDKARDSRTGVDLTGKQIADLDALITPLMLQGQSLNQIYLAHEHEIPCTKKSLYTHVNKGEVGPGRMYMIDAVKRKPRAKAKSNHKSIPRKSLSGRTYAEFLELDEEYRDGRWEMDTVHGKQGEGKCLLTLLHRPTRFQLAMLLERCSTDCVAQALAIIALALGEKAARVIYLVLTDNGIEFFDAEGTEEILGCKLYYCETYSSWQKGSAESNHKYYRRVIPKGATMQNLTEASCSLMMSHVNSTPRTCLGGLSPIEAILPIVGQGFLDALGIRNIPRDEVVLKPELINL